MMQRKKTCSKCQRILLLREFYKFRTGGHSPYCKECSREMKNKEYARNRKKPDGIFKDEYTDRLMEHNGCSTHIYWSPYMTEKLKRLYATTKNEYLTIEFSVSLRTIIRKARELGLEKDEQWMSENSRKNCKTMHILNKCCGNSGQIKKGQHLSPSTEFKKRKSI